MAIIAYTGVMGSGKTYEAVSTAILNALKMGRRVVTNISGINFEAIRDHLGPLKDGSMLTPDKILQIQSKRISEPYFFFDPEVPHETVVLPGDLVCIDEVWAFWGTDCKLLPEHQKFFRMHRHYTEQGTGTSCDLCIQIQDLMSLHRFIRGVLESTYKFTKLKTIGWSSGYRVEVYEGQRQRKASLVSVSVKKYDKKIFPLYQSYEGGAGSEKTVDNRQNLFRNKWFLGSMTLGLVGLIWFGWWFFNYVGHLRNGGQADPAKVHQQSASSQTQSQAPGQLPASGGATQLAGDARLVAVLEPTKGETLVIFQMSDGRFVRQRMNAGIVDGWQTVAGYQGRMVGFFFGDKSK